MGARADVRVSDLPGLLRGFRWGVWRDQQIRQASCKVPSVRRTIRAMHAPFEIPEELNMADWFLRARLREGHGDRTAIIAGNRSLTYAEVDRLAARFGNVLRGLGVVPE